MREIANFQRKAIFALLPPEYKEDRELRGTLIAQYAEKGSSVSDLQFHEAEELIYFLKTGKRLSNAAYATFDSSNTMHRYILSLCHTIGWVTYDAKLGRKVPDLEKLGAWIKKYGWLHKPLKQYKDAELHRLIAQLEKVAK